MITHNFGGVCFCRKGTERGGGGHTEGFHSLLIPGRQTCGFRYSSFHTFVCLHRTFATSVLLTFGAG